MVPNRALAKGKCELAFAGKKVNRGGRTRLCCALWVLEEEAWGNGDGERRSQGEAELFQWRIRGELIWFLALRATEKRRRLGDRISALPDEIIHTIIPSLDDTQQAARTSTLSRRWLHLWRSYPVLEFRGGDERSKASAAEYRKFARLAVASSRRLSLYHKNFRSGSPLEIVVRTGWPQWFPAGLLANCSRTKVLRLEGCDLNGLGRRISLQRLQFLHLKSVRITEQSVYNLVGNAGNLGRFCLESCCGIERLEISASNFPKLKTLVIRTSGSGPGSEYELQLTTAPFLEQLGLFEGEKEAMLASALCLKTFSLKDLKLSAPVELRQSHLNLISSLPFLESLSLQFIRCSSSSSSTETSKIRIWSHRLRVLQLECRERKVQELEIDAPNLVSAYCSRDKLWFPGKIAVVNASSDWRFVVARHDAESHSRTRLTQ
ncbi:unnamed protein product [Linum tenue]|uniref:At1g61320/AtMIF1 LRR domain-containing protein n=1 Tax=Linum tenue TaxID=586396 RepID=A0AAV0ILJ2_9ROSI|nr:unnamed protein product [Linum tenue]